jgi:hypothetical protein
MNCFVAIGQPGGTDSTTWIAILLGAFVLLYLSVLRPMLRKRKDPLEQTPGRSGLAQQRAVERDMQGLLVEYEKMIRSMTAGVDTRAARLEQLIREADDKLTAVRAAIAELQALPAAGGLRTSGSAPAAPSTPPAFGPLFTASATTAAGATPSGDPRLTEIYALADQGLSVRDVARRVGIPHGEVEVMLNVRPRANKPADHPAPAT